MDCNHNFAKLCYLPFIYCFVCYGCFTGGVKRAKCSHFQLITYGYLVRAPAVSFFNVQGTQQHDWSAYICLQPHYSVLIIVILLTNDNTEGCVFTKIRITVSVIPVVVVVLIVFCVYLKNQMLAQEAIQKLQNHMLGSQDFPQLTFKCNCVALL